MATPTRALVLACFFLSGASGLIFELVWTRQLTLVFGSTTLAISTVLATFMGGLGAGSWAASRFADRLRDPVRAYALCELAVGIYALAIPFALAEYPALNRWLWAALGDRYALLSVVRFAAAAVVLLLPTTLMGATLPILARALVTRRFDMGGIGVNLGRLYGSNLFGAMAGAFLAGFVLLPTLGVRATNYVAAAFNLSLAAALFALGPRLARRAPSATLDEAAAAASGEKSADFTVPTTRTARSVVLVAFMLSGLVAMTLQVLWTRALAVVLGSSVFSFTLILLGFLVGLGAGAALMGRLADRESQPVRALALLHLTIAAAVGLSYVIMDKLPYFFAWLVGSTEAGVDTIQACQFIAICASILPATLLMGSVFPLTVRVVTAQVEHVARDIGRAYALNTVGAIAGSFASGFVVLPALGVERGIYAATVVSLLTGAALFLVAPGLPQPRRLVGVTLAVALALSAPFLPRWNLVDLSVGFFRVSIAKDYLQRRREGKPWEKPRLVFYEDGVSTTVSVDQWGKTYSMKNNGKVDASSDADMPTQILVGLLPLLFYPQDPVQHPPRAALIGYGSGVTAGAMTQYPLGSLEVVELEPAVYRAARFFDHVNHRPLADPRVTARVGDGRNFLSQRRDHFDVIVSQPSNPWITGVSNLFTREYFRDVRGRLKEGGIFCQWAQLYEMAPWNVKTIYRTLRAEFAHVMAFAAEDLSSDTILIASDRPLDIDMQRLNLLLRDERLRKETLRAGLRTVHDLPAILLLGPEEVDAFTAGAALNTDDNARIEFAAPRDLLGYARYDSYLARIHGPLWPYGRLSGLLSGYDGADAPVLQGQLARSLFAHGKAREAGLWTTRAEARGGGPDAAHARRLLDLVAMREVRDPEVPLAPAGELQPPRLPADLAGAESERLARDYSEVEALMVARKYARAYQILERWPAKLWGKLGPDFTLVSGFLDYKTEFYSDAISELRPLADDAAFVARRPATLYYLGRAYFANADYGKAAATLERYLALGRDDTMSGDGRPSTLAPAAATGSSRKSQASGAQGQRQGGKTRPPRRGPRGARAR